VDLIAGMIGGLLAGLIFKQVWKLTGRGNAPKPTDERRGWGEILLAATLQGAIFALVKAAVDRGAARVRAGSPGSGRAMKASSPRSRPDHRQAKPCQIRARTREAQRSLGSHQEQREWRMTWAGAH
jgi:hypothetical protein